MHGEMAADLRLRKWLQDLKLIVIKQWEVNKKSIILYMIFC